MSLWDTSGRIPVSPDRTIPGTAIAAIGDVTPGPMLATPTRRSAKRSKKRPAAYEAESSAGGVKTIDKEANVGGARARREPEVEVGLGPRIAAMLDDIVRLNGVEPTVAWFPQTAVIDVVPRRCTPTGARRSPATARGEVEELLEDAIAAGELAAADQETVAITIRAMTEGLLLMGSFLPETQIRALEGLKRLLSGTLLVAGQRPRTVRT